MSVYISKGLREQVWNDAQGLCGYCQTHEELVGIAHEYEHLTPVALGGATIRENLWLSCRRCNSFKGDRVKGQDSCSNQAVRLFHPRNDHWQDHFYWEGGGLYIWGKTGIGRASVEVLQLNLSIVTKARSVWILSGRFPPI